MKFVAPALLNQFLLDVKNLSDGPGYDSTLVLVLLYTWSTLHGVGLT